MYTGVSFPALALSDTLLFKGIENKERLSSKNNNANWTNK
jgi:hypothetical protein